MRMFLTEIEKNGDVFVNEFRNSKQAVSHLQMEWAHMTDREQIKCSYAQVTLYAISENDEYMPIKTIYAIK